MLRFTPNRSFVRSTPLDGSIEPWPPVHDQTMTYFVPTYIDTSRSVLKRAVVDGFPDHRYMVMREARVEGTAYLVGTYGASWPLDTDRTEAPQAPVEFNWAPERFEKEAARQCGILQLGGASAVPSTLDDPCEPLTVFEWDEIGNVQRVAYSTLYSGPEGTFAAKPGTAWPIDADEESRAAWVRHVRQEAACT